MNCTVSVEVLGEWFLKLCTHCWREFTARLGKAARRGWDEETGKRRTLFGRLWAYLVFSRYMMVRLVWTNDIATTLDAIESMLRELGGVPIRLTSDNLKCFVTEASDYEPLLNPAFERFAQHYNTLIECLPPRSAEKRESRAANGIRTQALYEAHGSEWHGLEESQKYMDRKVALANERRHGTTQRRPIDDLTNTELSAHLKSLPALCL